MSKRLLLIVALALALGGVTGAFTYSQLQYRRHAAELATAHAKGRAEGRAEAEDSLYGLVPVEGAIDHVAADVSDEDWEALYALDAEALGAEADDTEVFLARMGAKVPAAVWCQHQLFTDGL